MDNLPKLHARWSDTKYDGYFIIEFFCVGKWRSSYIKARKPRPLKEKEKQSIRRQVSINTSGVQVGEIGVEKHWSE
jgi:hypothetical protein